MLFYSAIKCSALNVPSAILCIRAIKTSIDVFLIYVHQTIYVHFFKF